MSQNHPYRTSRTGYRSQEDFYEDTGSHYTGQRDVFQRPEELSPTQSYQPPSQSTEAHVTMRPDVMNILDSCGLEPSDLSLLAELPEDLITVETLPHLLKKLRDSKKQGLASASHFTASVSDPPAPAYERKRLSNVPEYRPDHSSHPSTATSRNRRETWQDDRDLEHRHTTVPTHHSRQGGASVYAVDYGHSGHEDLHQHDHSAGYRSEKRQSRISASSRHDIDYRHKSVIDGEPAYLRKKDMHHVLPTKTEASDFHGRTPKVFPYACQLCNIVVLSNKDWNQHVNCAQHADSQLKLLQRYPEWDCHVNSVRRDEEHLPARSAAHDHAKTARPKKRPNQSTEGSSNINKKRRNLKKVSEKPKVVGKVISVKYSAKSIDEDYLRRLLGQFGAIVKIIMFPSLAFVEMGSSDQAGDIEKYFSSNPLEVEGEQVFFAVSEAFKFLKSSKVVCFSPLPGGDGLSSEIAAIAKRFGPVKNTLFLPSRAYVEMTNPADAETMVNHHTSEPLKLKGSVIHVDFSSEYETLKDCPPETGTKCKSSERQTRKSHSPKTSVRSRSRSRSPRRTSRDRKDSKEKTRPSQSQKDSKETAYSSQNRKESTDTTHSCQTQKDTKDTAHSSRTRKDSKDTAHSSLSRKVSKERTQSSSEHQSSSSPKEAKPKVNSPVPEKGTLSTDTKDEKDAEATPSVAMVTHNSDSDSDLEGVAVIGEDDEMEGVEILNAVDSDDDKAEDEDGKQVTSRDSDQDGEQEMEEAAGVQEETAEKVKDERTEVQRPSENRANHSEPVEGSMESEAVAASSSEGEHKTRHTAEEPKQGETHSKSKKEVRQEASAQDQENEVKNEDQSESTAQEGEDTARDMKEVSQDMKDGFKEMEEDADKEEEFDFPENLENLITLDEVDDREDSSEERDAKIKTSSGSDQRVICLRNLPLTYYTDEEFWKIGKQYGEVARYFLIRNRCEGFIEMENGDDAKKAVSDLKRKNFAFHGYRLEVALSWKYKKLVNAWVPKSEKRHKHQSRRSSRSKERSRSRSSSKSKSQSKQTPSESKDKKSDQSKKHREDLEPSVEKSIETSRKPENLSQKSEEKAKSPVKEAQQFVSTDRVTTDEETRLGETIKVKHDKDDGQFKPNNPVGQEFVRPVVGYFCNLCNIIYATEEEAKNEHCSSLSHFQKFKEHLEKKT